jgi:hypothetical protein
MKMNESNLHDRLVEAVSQGDADAVRQCLAAGIDPNDIIWEGDGWTLMHEAVVHDVSIVKELLDNGANINASTYLGYTPMMRAAGKGCFEVVKYLVSRGADLTARDNQDLTAIDMAELEGEEEIADYLKGFFQDYVINKHSGLEQYKGYTLMPLADICLVMIDFCKHSFGGRVHRIDITFADGTQLNRIEVLENCVAVMPSDLSTKPISKYSVPTNQQWLNTPI